MNVAKIFEKTLEAFAVGDAMGMPTEFMTRETIRKNYGLIDRLLDPTCIPSIHKNLKKGQITDDTEQVLELIEAYYNAGKIDKDVTLNALRSWYEETNAAVKGFIGPSALKVLSGESNEGRGTTCGAAMRILAVSLSVKKGDIETLQKAIWESCLCTHYSDIAIEAAMALGFGYHYAALEATYDEIINHILQGAFQGRKMGPGSFAGAHTSRRIGLAIDTIKNMSSMDEVMDFIYEVIGTTMEANEVVPASVAIFSYAKGDVWLSIKMGASIGGDTDTIAAIAGALSTLYAKNHNIPASIVHEVLTVNKLDLHKYARMLETMFLGGISCLQ